MKKISLLTILSLMSIICLSSPLIAEPQPTLADPRIEFKETEDQLRETGIEIEREVRGNFPLQTTKFRLRWNRPKDSGLFKQQLRALGDFFRRSKRIEQVASKQPTLKTEIAKKNEPVEELLKEVLESYYLPKLGEATWALKDERILFDWKQISFRQSQIQFVSWNDKTIAQLIEMNPEIAKEKLRNYTEAIDELLEVNIPFRPEVLERLRVNRRFVTSAIHCLELNKQEARRRLLADTVDYGMRTLGQFETALQETLGIVIQGTGESVQIEGTSRAEFLNKPVTDAELAQIHQFLTMYVLLASHIEKAAQEVPSYEVTAKALAARKSLISELSSQWLDTVPVK